MVPASTSRCRGGTACSSTCERERSDQQCRAPPSSPSPSRVVVVLAAIAFVTVARRSDVRGAGALWPRDAQARRGRRDRARAEAESLAVGPRPRSPRPQAPASCPLPTAAPVPWTPPDPEADRRQPAAVPQPRHRRAHGRRPRHVRRRQLRGLPVAEREGRVRRQGDRRQDRRHPGRHRRRSGLLLRPQRPFVDHPLSRRTRCRRRRRVLRTRRSTPAWPPTASWRSTRSARTSAAECRRASRASGSSAPATVRSTTRSARRRAVRRRGAWTASPSRSTAAARRPSTPAPSYTGPPIGTNTTGQEAEGPHCIAGGGGRTDDRPAHDHGDRVDHLRVILVGWSSSTPRSTSGAARKELGSEIELAANRKPYYDDEALEGKRLELVQLVGVLLLVVIVIGLPLYWVLEPARQAGAKDQAADTLAGWGEELFATDRRRRLQLRRLPRRHEGHRWRTPPAPSPTRSPARCSAVNWYRAGAEHRAVPLQPGRGALHPHLRTSRLTDVGVGSRRRRPDERPADRHADRLPRHASRSRARTAPPTRRTTRNCATGHLPNEIQREIDTLANRAVESGEADSDGEALFNLELAGGAYSCARCHTLGWSYGEPRRQRPGRLRLEPHRRCHRRPLPRRTGHDRLRPGRLRERSRVRRAAVRAPAACRRSARCSPTSRSRPSSNTCGACDAHGARIDPRHRLGARAARHPHRHHRRRRADGLRLPHPRHQPRRPPRLPREHRRPRRLADADGRHRG